MFKEFNVKFEDVEMIGGADNILEGTEVTKVIVRGDSKMSSLDSAFKNCSQLDTIDGQIDLNEVSDIDNMLENSEFVKKISLKNINNENISANNSLSNIEEVSIGGELYSKAAIQNVIGSKDWTFDNIKYVDTIGKKVYEKSSEAVDENDIVINDPLEQKATEFEIIGQTYENLTDGKGEQVLIDELIIEAIDGNPTEFSPHIEQPICIETIEGETYQNLVNGKGEHKLTDPYNATWTESNNSVDNASSVIEIPEIWGNTAQGFPRAVTNKDLVNHINGLGFSNLIYEYVNDKTIKCTRDGNWGANNFIDKISNNNELALKLKPNTKYSFASSVKFAVNSWIVSTESTLLNLNNKFNGTFTTSSNGLVAIGLRYVGEFNFILVEGDVIPSSPTFDLEDIQSVGDLYTDENEEPILNEEGNKQYKLEIESTNKNLFSNIKSNPYEKTVIDTGGWGGIFYSSFDKCTYKLWKDVANGNLTPVISILYPTDKGYIEDKPILQKGKTYTLSGIFKWSEKTQRSLEIGFFDIEMNQFAQQFNLYGKVIGSVKGKFESTTFTLDKDAYGMYIKLPYGGEYAFDLEISNFMIEENTVATDYVSPQLNKTTILMPCQLMKVSDGVDELFWDVSKNKYIIKKNVRKMIINGDTRFISERNQNGYTLYNIDTYQSSKPNGSKFINDTFPTGTDFGDTTSEWMMAMWSSKLYLSISNTRGRVNDWFRDNPTTVYYHSTISETVETKILEKPALETYSPTTHISTNSEVQPSQMNITNKKVIFAPELQTNKDYTLQLNSIGKDSKSITVNLGGTETTIQPVNDTNEHHKVVIRTPGTLVNNNLELSGEGVIVNDIMLFDGGENVIKQNVEYIDGIQSMGKSQEDGTYKIDILMGNEWQKTWEEM